VKRGKNDRNDAAAICEAAGRPGMRFVLAKTEDRQVEARETVGRQSAQPPAPRVDAGVQELSEMTIGRTDDPENPLLATAGQPGRVIVWGWIAEPIWASGHAAAPTGRTHERNRTARQVSSTFLLHPRGRPHMRVATGRGRPATG
jgi:hypothetical protein